MMSVFYMAIGSFYCYLVHFVGIEYIYGYFVYFSPFWYIVSRKIWQPWVWRPASVSHFWVTRREIWISIFQTPFLNGGPFFLEWWMLFKELYKDCLFSYRVVCGPNTCLRWKGPSPDNDLSSSTFNCSSNASLKSGKRQMTVLSRVARWFIFKQKIPIWVIFGGL
jgi:hypothetical protein